MLYYIIGFGIIIWAIVIGVKWTKLRAFRLRKGRHERIEPDRLPDHLMPLFTAARKIFSEIGFSESHYLMSESLFLDDRLPIYSLVFCQSSGHTFAWASAPETPNLPFGFETHYTTHFSDGTVISTVDYPDPMPIPDKYGYSDQYVADPLKQWDIHQARVASAEGKQPIPLSSEQYTAYRNQLCNDLIEHNLKTGLIAKTSEDACWRLKPLKTLVFMRLIAKALAARGNAVKLEGPAPDEFNDARNAGDADVYERVIGLNRNARIGTRLKYVIFGISAVVFFLVFGWVCGWDIMFVGALLVVLLFHELGHFVGMKISGYTDPHIMFIPLLGAVTVGTDERAKPWQKLLVYLLGPTPGILIGLVFIGSVLVGTETNPFFQILVLLLLVINYFNLLPVTPLDGGRIVELLCFSKYPRGRFFFWMASLLVLFAIGLRLFDPILIMVSAFLLFSLPSHWRTGAAFSHIKTKLSPDADNKERYLAITQTLALPRFQKIRNVQCVETLHRQLSEVSPRVVTILMGILIYGLLLAPPIYYLAKHGLKDPLESYLYEKILGDEDIRVETNLKRARNDEERWSILFGAGQTYDEIPKNRSKQYRYCKRALEIAETFPDDSHEKGQTLVHTALVTDDPDEYVTLIRRALKLVENNYGLDHPFADRFLELIESKKPGAVENDVYLKEIAGIRKKTKPDHPESLGEWRDPSTGMVFVHVSGGDFWMGWDSILYWIDNPEKTNVADFWIGKYEVTVGQWKQFVTDTNYRLNRENYLKCQGSADPEFAQEDSHPVVCVSYAEAVDFAQWLSDKNGGELEFRLPMEKEWKYVCKAGKNITQYWEDNPGDACRHANVADWRLKLKSPFRFGDTHPCYDGFAETAPVGSFEPNRLGLYDMLGNAGEWTANGACNGGAWNSHPQNVCCTGWSYGIDKRDASSGFRLARGPVSSEDLKPYAQQLIVIGNTAQDKTESARRYQMALSLVEKKLGPNHSVVADILEEIALTRSGTIGDDQKIAYLKRVIDIHEKNGELGKMAAVLTKFANLYEKTGNSQKSSECLDRALAIYDADLESHSIEMAHAICQIATNFSKAGEFSQAEALFTERIEQVSRLTDSDKKRDALLMLRERLGWIHIQVGEYDNALEWLESALSLSKEGKMGGFKIALDLSHVCLEMGDTESAKRYYDQAQTLFAGGGFGDPKLEEYLDRFPEEFTCPPETDDFWRLRACAHHRVLERMKPDDPKKRKF